jgi:hypothetical protein
MWETFSCPTYIQIHERIYSEEKSHVISVGKISFIPVSLKDIIRLTLDSNHKYRM